MKIEARLRIDRGAFALDLALELPGRGVNAVYGPSGCGKTTLLRAIAGLERDPSGYLRVGEQVWQDGDHFVPTHRRALGYVFQEPSLFPHLDVRGNLQYGLRRTLAADRRIALDTAIELLDLAPLLARSSEQLSGGERQRVAIARALAASPRLLLMDEPLAALDQARKHEIMPYLESLHRELEIPVIYVSHALGEIARLADYLVLLEQGRVVAAGEATGLFTRTDLPLTHDDRAAAVIEARVEAHDDSYDLTYLRFAGGRFSVSGRELPVGQTVRLRVFARDVSITLTAQSDTSILNIFAATVEEIVPYGKAQAMLRLNASGVAILARLTRKSVERLALSNGRQVFAQVKSVALLS
jgi:molybdate transport system ATP-binding protein